MDEGDIIAQEKVGISDNDDSQSLSDKLFAVGGKMLVGVIDMAGAYCNTPIPIRGIKQNNSEATYCKIIKKEDGKIDFKKPAKRS